MYLRLKFLKRTRQILELKKSMNEIQNVLEKLQKGRLDQKKYSDLENINLEMSQERRTKIFRK